jgi:hypothetical protein
MGWAGLGRRKCNEEVPDGSRASSAVLEVSLVGVNGGNAWR